MSELPVSWASAGLGEITTISPKFNADDVKDEHLVHFVPMAATDEEFGGVDVSQLRPLREVRKGYTTFAEGDVLFAKITPCMENGKGGLVPRLPHKYAFGSTEFHVLRPSEAITSLWLAHFLSQAEFRKIARRNMTGTAGQLRVPTKWLETVRLPVPPLSEQTRIVEKLEELLGGLDAAVGELKAAQRKLTHYRQSLLKAAMEGALTEAWRSSPSPCPRSGQGEVGRGLLLPSDKSTPPQPSPSPSAKGREQETGTQLLHRILQERRTRWEAKQQAKFAQTGKTPPKGWQSKYPEPAAPDTTDLPALPEGWAWASLDALVADSSYGTSAKCGYGNNGTPVLRIPNVSGGDLDLRDMKFSDGPLPLTAEDFLDIGDVLVIRTNGSIGLVGRAAAVTAPLPAPHYFASYLLRLRCVNRTVLHHWVSTFLASPVGRRWIEERAASSAGQHNVSLSTLLTMPVPLPPLEEQTEILTIVDTQLSAAKEQETAITHSLHQTAAQRRNLLRAAFSGQLVPQDPNDEPASELLARIRAAKADNARPAAATKRGRKPKGNT